MIRCPAVTSLAKYMPGPARVPASVLPDHAISCGPRLRLPRLDANGAPRSLTSPSTRTLVRPAAEQPRDLMRNWVGDSELPCRLIGAASAARRWTAERSRPVASARLRSRKAFTRPPHGALRPRNGHHLRPGTLSFARP